MTRPARLTAGEIQERLHLIPGWTLGQDTIQRRYQSGGWRVSMLIANAAAYVCEAANHHADVLVTWPSVSVSLSTHDAGGVTELDFEVARQIEAHVMWRPGKDSSLSGQTPPLAT